ncbi:hypothetical protein O5D80_005534 [Batrachochytrium dendrobatidis]|nr:hypothetical protein O5D80_005534 [Batrachochytrium dendrobatidis]
MMTTAMTSPPAADVAPTAIDSTADIVKTDSQETLHMSSTFDQYRDDSNSNLVPSMRIKPSSWAEGPCSSETSSPSASFPLAYVDSEYGTSGNNPTAPDSSKRLESFFGFVSTPLDAAILIHAACSQSDIVTPIKRRLLSVERDLIRSGSIFVFTESDSGMKRWTDGMRWSKSRVEGQFLVYRRVDPKRPSSGFVASTGAVTPSGPKPASSLDSAPASGYTTPNGTNTTSVTVQPRTAFWLDAVDASNSQLCVDQNMPCSASSMDNEDHVHDYITVASNSNAATVTGSHVGEPLSSTALASSNAACLAWAPDSQQFYALGKRSHSPTRSSAHHLPLPTRPSSAMSYNSAPASSPAATDDYDKGAIEDVEYSGFMASNPVMKRQRTLENSMPTRLHSAPIMRRQTSTESTISTTSFGSAGGSPYTDDTLSKKTFSVKIRGVVSHVICYFTRMDVASGILPIPASCKGFADLVVPREYLDPGNFRLHPKGSTFGSVSATPSMSSDVKVASVVNQFGDVSANPEITSRPRSIAPASSSTRLPRSSSSSSLSSKKKSLLGNGNDLFSTPPPQSFLSCIIAAAESIHFNEMDHANHMDTVCTDQPWISPYSLPTPPPSSKSSNAQPISKRSIRSRLRSERLVTITLAEATLYDVPLPLEFQDLHEQISQLFAVSNAKSLCITLAGLGEICDIETFSLIHSGDVLNVTLRTSPLLAYKCETLLPAIKAEPRSEPRITPEVGGMVAGLNDMSDLSEATTQAALALATLSGASGDSSSMNWQPNPVSHGALASTSVL